MRVKDDPKIVSIRAAVSNIVIKPRGTVEGNVQREAFRIRWGKKPEQL